jgi:hypothetical protein
MCVCVCLTLQKNYDVVCSAGITAISTKEWKAQLLKNVNISSITDQTTIALEHEVVHGETCCVCISFFSIIDLYTLTGTDLCI